MPFINAQGDSISVADQSVTPGWVNITYLQLKQADTGSESNWESRKESMWTEIFFCNKVHFLLQLVHVKLRAGCLNVDRLDRGSNHGNTNKYA